MDYRLSSVVVSLVAVATMIGWGNHPLPVIAEEGTEVTIITTDTPNNTSDVTTSTYALASEPVIRVGLGRVIRPTIFVSHDDDYRVVVGDREVGVVVRGSQVSFAQEYRTMILTAPGMVATSTSYIRLEPITNHQAIFDLPRMERYIRGKGTVNFNRYRGVFEIRLSKHRTWHLVNELPLEEYLAGIAETSPNSPMEYLKAVMTAARTYAYYTAETDKHDDRYFDVVATTGDQLYLGYENERSMPRVREAAEATRGLMVHYGGRVVVTPYFASSSGQTRAWHHVWGGEKRPWLVPVTATYDARARRPLYGHGVGMSGRDAEERARRENIDFISLLKYYYSGIEVVAMYE